MPPSHQDLTRTTLSVLFIGGLIVACLWLMRPFLPAIIWALTLVIATWPLMLKVQRHTGNRRGVAVLVMSLALLAVLVVPCWLAVSTIAANTERIAGLVETVLSLQIVGNPEEIEPPDRVCEEFRD